MPGRPANRGSFKIGNVVNVGRDKSLNMTNWVERSLDRTVPNTVDEYGEAITYRKLLADKVIDTAAKTENEQTALAYIKEIMDRTEGKAMQRSQNTNMNVNIDVIAD